MVGDLVVGAGVGDSLGTGDRWAGLGMVGGAGAVEAEIKRVL